MESVTAFLAHQPLLALFLVIATGYALGAVNIRGFSLGVGAVIFSGLFVGALVPKAQPPALVGTLGLVMFLYGIGVQFGRQFFAGLAGRAGRRSNLLALLALAAAASVAVAERALLGVSHAMAAGLFAGAGTNSATMQAALEAAGNSDPAVGYSVAYPFGLVGAILCMYVMQMLAKPRLEASLRSGLQVLEVAVRSSDVVGRALGALLPRMPRGVQVLAVRVRDENRHPEPGLVLSADDVLLLGSDDEAALDAARQMVGRTRGRPRRRATAAGSTMCACSCRGRTWWARVWPTCSCPRAWRRRSRTCSAATPRCWPRRISPSRLGDRVGLLTDRAASRR